MTKRQVTVKIFLIKFDKKDSARIEFHDKERQAGKAIIQTANEEIMHKIRCVVGLGKFIILDMWHIEDEINDHYLVYRAEREEE